MSFKFESRKLQEKCVTNPLIAAFKMFINGDLKSRNRTIDRTLLMFIADALSSDFLAGVSNLLGGITYDEKHRITGAKAIMLPYALRHSTPFQDGLAEKWELKLADFLLKYSSRLIRASLWTYETLASESAKDREQLLR
ncbi:unnamed protein product [Gongylonema pulchrum]|uniref:COesterase domain-containing protein n=1 Tax=Gongylonema pulchrum TaxID=637853 RepID=A0A183CY81_9BILA|nr:unnamed protein product [Gongylonema pulchrum]